MNAAVIILAPVATVVVLSLHLAVTLAARARVAPRPRWGALTRLVYGFWLVSVVILAGTGFYGILAHDVMEGWLLFAHVLAAGPFLAFLAVLAVIWAHASRFAPGDEPRDRRFGFLTRVTFWVLLTTGTATSLTMLLAMLPVFSSSALVELTAVHRYAGLALLLSAMIHLYLVVLSRLSRA